MGYTNKRGEKRLTSPATVGATAPDFTLSTETGDKWRLSDQLGKITVLLFYPKSETLVCTKQLCSVRDYWEEYLKSKAAVVAVSPGTIEEHLRFSDKYSLPMPILADENRLITKIYCEQRFIPINFIRAVFVIDARGIIRKRMILLRAFRPDDREILAAIRSARTDAMIHWSESDAIAES